MFPRRKLCVSLRQSESGPRLRLADCCRCAVLGAWTHRLIRFPTTLTRCALALNAFAERDAALAERDRLADLNDRLRHLLRKAQGFEAKSERLAKLDPDQLNLALEDLEQAVAKSEALEEKTRAAETPRKRRTNRGALPAHLPRIHETVAADADCPCRKPAYA